MPASATRPPRPLAVLFACGLNAVRSPMAAGLFAQMFGPSIYVSSAGVRKGELDPFAIAVMAELGLDISKHKPVTFEELDEWEGLNFDLIITLAPEAHHRALELTRTMRRRCRILADGRSDRRRRQPRAAARRLSGGARPAYGANPRSAFPGRVPATSDDEESARRTARLGFVRNGIGGGFPLLPNETASTICRRFSAVVERPVIR